MRKLEEQSIFIDALARLHFLHRRDGIFTASRGPDAMNWLGLNRARAGLPRGDVVVSPIIGVHLQSVERLVAQLAGVSFHPYIPPTTSIGLGYVMPQKRLISWLVRRNESTSAMTDIANELASALVKYGLPYLETIETPASILPVLLRSSRTDQAALVRSVVTLHLTRRDSDASELLRNGVGQLGAREDAAARELRIFAVAFEQLLGAQRS